MVEKDISLQILFDEQFFKLFEVFMWPLKSNEDKAIEKAKYHESVMRKIEKKLNNH